MVFLKEVSFGFGGYPKLSGSMLFSRTKPLLRLLQSEISPGFIQLHSSTFDALKLNPDASGLLEIGSLGERGLSVTAKETCPIWSHVQAPCSVTGRGARPLLPAFPHGSVFKFWVCSSCPSQRMVPAQRELPVARGVG